MEDNERNVDFIASCYRGSNEVEFYIGSECINIIAGPGEKDCYEITMMRTTDQNGEEVFFSYQFPLTKEEFDAAWYHSMEDFMFVDEIDSLVAKRVARDLFSFLLMSLGTESNSGGDDMDDRYMKEWESYCKYLLHERMEGRTIAAYHPGFEPEDDLKQEEENKSE